MATTPTANGQTTGGPLAGVQVVELASGLGVAYCGQLFAHCGAEVVRVEPPEGDAIRRAGPFPGDTPDLERGGLHRVLNGGKRSVALDVEGETGARLAARLIERADVLIASWQTPAALPLDEPKALAERFPDLIYLSISSFGTTGPYAGYRADSHVLEALAGMSYVSGDPEREPLSLGVELADYSAGVHGFVAALAALNERDAGVQHHFIDLASFDALTMTDDYNLSLYSGSGALRKRYYSRVLVTYPSDIMPCKDGYVSFVPRGNDFGPAIAKLIGRPELAEHPVFASSRERILRWREFDEFIRPWLERTTAEDAVKQAQQARLGFAMVPDARDLLLDEHLRSRDAFPTLEDGAVTLGPPFRFSASPARTALPTRLGADNVEALRLTPEQAALLARADA